MNTLYKQALDDYFEIVNITKTFDGGLKELCEKLNGFNFDEYNEQFDCNFKSITVTIYCVNNELNVFRYIDIWDDVNCCIEKECFDYVDLLELIED